MTDTWDDGFQPVDATVMLPPGDTVLGVTLPSVVGCVVVVAAGAVVDVVDDVVVDGTVVDVVVDVVVELVVVVEVVVDVVVELVVVAGVVVVVVVPGVVVVVVVPGVVVLVVVPGVVVLVVVLVVVVVVVPPLAANVNGWMKNVSVIASLVSPTSTTRSHWWVSSQVSELGNPLEFVHATVPVPTRMNWSPDVVTELKDSGPSRYCAPVSAPDVIPASNTQRTPELLA